MDNLLSTIRGHFNALPNWAKCAVVGVPALVILKKIASRKPRKSPYKSDWKQGMVYLYQFSRHDCLPSLSPFCLKLETWLRMADIPYENVPIPFSVRSREGTLPFVELNGLEYPDSTFAIRDLTRILSKDHLEKDFSPQEKGASRAIEKMTEASTLISYAYVRYVEKFYEIMGEFMKGDDAMHVVMRFAIVLFGPFIRRKIKQAFLIGGVGKHPREEILNIGFDDLRALSFYLGEKKYMMGDKASKVDASVFGILAQIIYITSVPTPHLEMMKSECSNLLEYTERIKTEYWPDWDEVCGKKLLNTDWKKFKND